MKFPFIKFFPTDWLAEPSLRACSLAARGLWMDMLSMMHLAPRRGYLLAATGSPISPVQLARMTGSTADEVTQLLAELRSSGAFSCTDDGTIYSRRMVREEGKRELCSEAGRRGGGNPKLQQDRGTFKGDHKGSPKGAPKGDSKLLDARGQKLEAEEEPPNPPKPGGGGEESGDGKKSRKPPQNPSAVPIPTELDSPDFRKAWADWIEDRRARGKRVTELAAKQNLEKLAPLGITKAIESIQDSIRNGWTGIFPKTAAPRAAPAKPTAETLEEKILRIGRENEAKRLAGESA